MGYDVTRFQGDVDEDLICPICSGVLEEPVQVISLPALPDQSQLYHPGASMRRSSRLPGTSL
ncbi:RNF41 isoform 10 [Pan troglodytes]|uniref:Ring finger protein 41 n=3 Tax=Hominidae TaxID=9604 RepID=F8VSE5_HUMAN|nr:ring finger protein 41 [Homo sapiens]KAI4066588.1 ring finger protein 41 [Homo sapiens]PNI90164.1 RNF41 isoform 10 [Pan troglodytes]PNJ44819.1 RNF41 isoform 10 [Pongo abelii]